MTVKNFALFLGAIKAITSLSARGCAVKTENDELNGEGTGINERGEGRGEERRRKGGTNSLHIRKIIGFSGMDRREIHKQPLILEYGIFVRKFKSRYLISK